MAITYKQVIDTPGGFCILARETDDGKGVVWEEWNSDTRQWVRSEWACDVFHGVDDFAVKNVRHISTDEAEKILERFGLAHMRLP